MSLKENRGEINESENVSNQGKNDRRKPSILEIMITDKQKSQVFGLNHLQDVKGEPTEIPGAYDHKQERWIMQKPVDGQHKTWSPTGTGGGRDKDSVQD